MSNKTEFIRRSNVNLKKKPSKLGNGNGRVVYHSTIVITYDYLNNQFSIREIVPHQKLAGNNFRNVYNTCSAFVIYVTLCFFFCFFQ